MLTDAQLEIISSALIPLFQYLEKEVIADIAKRIEKSLTYSRTAELEAIAMRELGYSPARIRKEAMKILNADPDFQKAVAENTLAYKRAVKDMLASIIGEAYGASEDILTSAGDLSWENDLGVWEDEGKTLSDRSYLSELVGAFKAQTDGELKNMTGTTGFKTVSGYEALENAYRRELDKAVMKICSGTFSREKVIEDVIHDLAQSGLRSIDFASGYSMQLDTAVRLAIRTGCHQLSARITDQNILQTGVNLVYVSKHWGARNTGTGHANHEQWQGKVYFVKEGTDYSGEAKRIGQERIMSLWYATGYSIDGSRTNDPLGLNGYNCRHTYYPWFEGSSSLPDEDPEPAPVTVNGKTYDYYAMTQKMRSMERAVRALKREKEALKELGMDTTEIQAKIRRKTAEYEEFCENCKIQTKKERLRYECGTSELKKTKAWNEYSDIVQSDDIINKIEFPVDKLKTAGIDDQQIKEIRIGVNEISEEYNLLLNRVRLSEPDENISSVPIYYSVSDNNVRELIINPNHEMWRNEKVFWDRVEKTKFTAARGIREAVWHELAHAITYTDCKDTAECIVLEKMLQKEYVPGISRYNDISKDGSETIAEAFVKMRKGLQIPEDAKKLVNEYVEVRRKW